MLLIEPSISMWLVSQEFNTKSHLNIPSLILTMSLLKMQSKLEMVTPSMNSSRVNMMKDSTNSGLGGVLKRIELLFSWLMLSSTKSSSTLHGTLTQNISWPANTTSTIPFQSMVTMKIIITTVTTTSDSDQISLTTIYYPRENTFTTCTLSPKLQLTVVKVNKVSSYYNWTMTKLVSLTALSTKTIDT